jgi:hypothetical protein
VAGRTTRPRRGAGRRRRLNAAGPLICADVDRLRARIEWNVGSASFGHRILLQAARDVAPDDPERAREMAMMAAAAATFGADSGVDIDPMAFVGDPDAAISVTARCSALLLTGFAHVGQGRLDVTTRVFKQVFTECDTTRDVDLLSNLGLAAMHVGDDAVVLGQFGRLAAQARETGAMLLVLYALTRRAVAEVTTGDWAAAVAGSLEALDLARGTGKEALGRLPRAWLALLSALRGDTASHDTYMAELDRPDRPRDAGLTSVITQDVVSWAKGVASPSATSALRHLDQVSHVLVRRMSAWTAWSPLFGPDCLSAPPGGPTSWPPSPT